MLLNHLRVHKLVCASGTDSDQAARMLKTLLLGAINCCLGSWFALRLAERFCIFKLQKG